MFRRQRASQSNQPTRSEPADQSKRRQPDPDFVYEPHRRAVIETHNSAVNPVVPSRLKVRLKAASAVVLAIMLVGGYIGLRFVGLRRVIVTNTNAAPVNLSQKLDFSQYTSEGDSRINILMLGIGDVGHAGADLSDSMMVVSIDPRTHDVAMLGIPRDLYVKIPGHGYDKINAANALGDNDSNGGGPQLSKTVVSQTLGIPIHYFIRTDFTGLKKAVDTLNGVTVAVPQALHDPEYPCSYNEKRACGVTIQAGTQQMNGTVALEYARCRKGNCGSDFGRAHRQQQLLTAMRDKALTLSTLVNPSKLTTLVDIVGDHVRTDIALSEMQKLYNVFKVVDTSAIQTTVLDNSQNDLVTTATVGDQSVVVPTAGRNDYSAIQLFVRKLFFDGELKKENATLAVENATGNPATGQSVCNLLNSYSYNVVSCTNATQTTAHSQLLDYTHHGKPATLQYLQKRFNLKAQDGHPDDAAAGPELKLTLGTDYHPTQ